MSMGFWTRDWTYKLTQFGLIVVVVLASGAFVLMGPSLTWYAAAAAAGGLLTLGLAVGDMRRVLITAIAFLIPFYIHKALFVRESSVGEIVSMNVAVIDVILLLLIFLWLADAAVDRHSKLYMFPSTTVPVAIWLLVSALSIPGAIDPVAGLFQLVSMVRAVIMYLVVANQIRVTSDTVYVFVALLLGLCLQCALGIYQAWSGQPLGLWFLGESPEVREFALDIGLVARPHGTLGHPNDYAMYLEILLPLAFTLLFSQIIPLYKFLIGLAFCLGVVSLVLSLSRGGWLGFGLATVVVLFFLIQRRMIRAQRILSILAWGSSMLLIMAITFSGLIASRLLSSDEGSAASRLLLMHGAIAIVKDNPLLGVGLDNYALAAPEYNPSNMENWDVGATYVHNAFLLIGAEIGIFGLSAFVWSFLAFLKQGLYYVRKEALGLNWLIGLGIFAGSLSVLLHSQADYALLANPSLTTLFSFSVGWLMAIRKSAEAETWCGEIEI